MFKYPNAKPQPVKSIAQHCLRCLKWFTLPVSTTQTLEETWWAAYAASQKGETIFFPFIMCTCDHCCKEQIAVMIGKYDKPGAAREQCAVQHVTLGE